MPTYVPLGSRPGKTFGPDTSDLNVSNLSITFTPDDINCSVPFFEIEHYALDLLLDVTGVPDPVILRTYINRNLWEVIAVPVVPNGIVTYTSDPHVAPTLRPGDSVTFALNVSTEVNLPLFPTMIFWLRYDQEIQANQNALLNTPPSY